MTNGKKERIWNDPPGLKPEIPLSVTQDQLDQLEKWRHLAAYPAGQPPVENRIRRWKYLYIGMIYTLIGVVIKVMSIWEIPLDSLPFTLILVGLFFISIGITLYKQTGERRWGNG